MVDFIDFGVGNWHWYAFNLADSLGVARITTFLAYVLLLTSVGSLSRHLTAACLPHR